MAAPDMDVIKEIPGYKVILKAVLKSQIQQLVEQLATTTDEESVILTASVSDGTLSHLGSDSGKGFLEDHEDIKSQFLGFCLKKHHRKKQEEKEKQEAEALQFSLHTSPARYGAARYPQSVVPGQVHPVSIVRAGPVSNLGGNVRHEPYPVSRPGRRRSSGSVNQSPKVLPQSPSTKPADEQIIKQEAEESNDSVSAPSKTMSGDNDDDNSNTLPEEAQEESAGQDADLSNVIPGSNPENTESGDTDSSINVKLEAITEAEMDLEITGVEPGRPILPQDTWDANVSMATGYDPNMSAVAMSSQQADAQKPSVAGLSFEDEEIFRANPYRVMTESNITAYVCNYGNCRKICPNKTLIDRHIRVHTKEKPFSCQFCDYKASRKDTLKSHERKLHPMYLSTEYSTNP